MALLRRRRPYALHLASSTSAERFATFDAKLAKRARGVTALPVLQI